ncbi:MATE family efflux transporter [Ruminococcaceae bacterium OttesenSCG-928-A16]|nr:MATE family efflux transporter [Ruminococcaceae bacterium OttesenSCG-928-A16]
MQTKTFKPIAKQFVQYTIPAVLGMVVSSLYTVVDGIFVGRGVGDIALASVNIVYPFIMLQIAVTMLVAVGGANLFSISRGRGQHQLANNYFCQAVSIAAVLSVVINVGAIIFSAPLCRLLGANSQLLPGAQSYLFWVALFGIVYMPGLALSIFVRNDGAPKLEMAGTICGALTNIVLDWLFIMVFGWGLPGAAIATGIGQCVSVVIFCTHLRKRAGGTLRLTQPKMHKAEVKKLLYNGLPSFLMEFSQSAVTLSFNMVLVARIGAAGVSAYSIVMYVCSIFNMVLIGVTQGAQPILSFNHGKGKTQNIKTIYHLGTTTCVALTALFYGVVLLFGKNLASLFAPGNTQLINNAYSMMRLYFLGFFPIGIVLMNILWFQSTEREAPSIIISLLRCIGFIQLFLLVLPLLGSNGIYLAFLAGEACHLLISEVFLRKFPLTIKAPQKQTAKPV